MTPTIFQPAEIRDSNDNIIRQGAYGKNSPLANATNDAWIDYVMNNLEALRSMSVGAVIPVETLPESGETGKAYIVTTGTDAGKLFMWDGEDWVEITGSIGDYLPITGGTITGNLAVDGNLTAVTQLPNDNSTKVATTEYVQNEVKPIETDVTINDKRITNIEKLLQGNLYDYQTDSTSGYTKAVPSGAMPYAGLEKVGGETIVYNQLLQNGNFVDSSGWRASAGARTNLSVSGNEATLTVINAPSGSSSLAIEQDYNTDFIAGHKYYTSIEAYSPYATQIRARNTAVIEGSNLDMPTIPANTWTRCSGIFTGKTASAPILYTCIDYANFQVGDSWKCRNIWLTDLTLLYGAGNEPTTVAEFESMFPASYYPYNAGTLLSAGVTSVESVGSNIIDESKYKNALVNGTMSFYANGYYYDLFTGTTGVLSSVSDLSKILCLNAGTYTLCADNSNTRVKVTVIGDDGTMKEAELAIMPLGENKSATFTLTERTYITLRCGERYDLTIQKLRIVRGSNVLPYKPYFSATYPIPAEVQALEGYGWSAGTAYNYVDFERKVFVQNVARVDLGTLTWKASSTANPNFFYTESIASAIKNTSDNNAVANIISSIGVPYSRNNVNAGDYRIACAANGNVSYYSSLQNPGTMTEAQFKSSVSGVYLYYELATPIETDISAYLTDDNLINVESGGTLTFENQHGDDYQIPVPSEETYMIDLQSAL